MNDPPTICIIGAGIAGLSCAYYLEKQGYAPLLLEREERPGGRVKTDSYHGYLMDQGFQVLLSSYEEVNKIIRPYELEGHAFPSGARVRYGGKWHTFSNPLRHPWSFWQASRLPFAQFSDLVKTGWLYLKSATSNRRPLFSQEQELAIPFLEKQGVSKPFIAHFLRPFFGGVFLDPELRVNADLFCSILHFFAEGKAFLPKGGMEQLPKKMAAKLKATRQRYGVRVSAVEGQRVFLANGEEIQADKIVIATSGKQAGQLLPHLPQLSYRSSCTIYCAVDRGYWPADSQLLHLNGDEGGPISSLAAVSAVEPSYAPTGKWLLSLSVLDPLWQQKKEEELQEAIAEQLGHWFGLSRRHYQQLKSYFIEEALPEQSHPPLLQKRYGVDRQPDIYLCGEYVDQASLNGAAASGREVAQKVHEAIDRLKQAC